MYRIWAGVFVDPNALQNYIELRCEPFNSDFCKDFNTWAYLLRMLFLSQASLSVGLLLPLNLATVCFLPCIILGMLFMILFLLSFSKCGGFRHAKRSRCFFHMS